MINDFEIKAAMIVFGFESTKKQNDIEILDT